MLTEKLVSKLYIFLSFLPTCWNCKQKSHIGQEIALRRDGVQEQNGRKRRNGEKGGRGRRGSKGRKRGKEGRRKRKNGGSDEGGDIFGIFLIRWGDKM